MITRFTSGYRLFCRTCKTDVTPVQEIHDDKNNLTTAITFRCNDCKNILATAELVDNIPGLKP